MSVGDPCLPPTSKCFCSMTTPCLSFLADAGDHPLISPCPVLPSPPCSCSLLLEPQGQWGKCGSGGGSRDLNLPLPLFPASRAAAPCSPWLEVGSSHPGTSLPLGQLVTMAGAGGFPFFNCFVLQVSHSSPGLQLCFRPCRIPRHRETELLT